MPAVTFKPVTLSDEDLAKYIQPLVLALHNKCNELGLPFVIAVQYGAEDAGSDYEYKLTTSMSVHSESACPEMFVGAHLFGVHKDEQPPLLRMVVVSANVSLNKMRQHEEEPVADTVEPQAPEGEHLNG